MRRERVPQVGRGRTRLHSPGCSGVRPANSRQKPGLQARPRPFSPCQAPSAHARRVTTPPSPRTCLARPFCARAHDCPQHICAWTPSLSPGRVPSAHVQDRPRPLWLNQAPLAHVHRPPRALLRTYIIQPQCVDTHTCPFCACARSGLAPSRGRAPSAHARPVTPPHTRSHTCAHARPSPFCTRAPVTPPAHAHMP